VSDKADALHKIIDLLDEPQLDVLYNVASSFAAQLDPDELARLDFDYISPEESEAIERAFEEMRRGECLSFVPEDELKDYLKDR
jgi:hypothetical protein